MYVDSSQFLPSNTCALCSHLLFFCNLTFSFLFLKKKKKNEIENQTGAAAAISALHSTSDAVMSSRGSMELEMDMGQAGRGNKGNDGARQRSYGELKAEIQREIEKCEEEQQRKLSYQDASQIPRISRSNRIQTRARTNQWHCILYVISPPRPLCVCVYVYSDPTA